MASVIEIGVDLNLTESLKDLDTLDTKLDKTEKKVKKANGALLDFANSIKASINHQQSLMDTTTQGLTRLQSVAKQAATSLGNVKFTGVDPADIKKTTDVINNQGKAYSDQVKQNTLVTKAFISDLTQASKIQAALSDAGKPLTIVHRNTVTVADSSQVTVDRVNAVKAWSSNVKDSSAHTRTPSPVVPPSVAPPVAPPVTNNLREIQAESRRTSDILSRDLSTPFTMAGVQADKVKSKLQEVQIESSKAVRNNTPSLGGSTVGGPSFIDNVRTGAGLGVGAIGADRALSGIAGVMKDTVLLGADFTYMMSKVRAVALGGMKDLVEADRQYILLHDAARAAGRPRCGLPRTPQKGCFTWPKRAGELGKC